MTNYEAAKEKYKKIGIDTEKVLETLKNVPVSLHCWQGDDVVGFENADIQINKAPGSLVQMPANSNLNDLVTALNAIGVAPIDLISILQALKKSGSLQAELIVI